MIITKTPYRISFFGGGTDYPPHYRSHGGSVLSTSIDKYCYISLRQLPPFFSHKHRIVYSTIECVNSISEINHPAVRGIFDYLNVTDGLELHYDGDLPARSGVGSSSAFTVGLLHALHAHYGCAKSKRFLFEEAIFVEQEVINEPVGSQDQVACAMGGFNHITFNTDSSILVSPVICDKTRLASLQGNLLMFYTGIQRYSTDITESKLSNIKSSKSKDSLFKMNELTDVALKIIQDPELDLDQFGYLLHDSWMLKRTLSERVSTDYIDSLYTRGIDAGALGGKILGAGGGGFLLFYVPLDRQAHFKELFSDLVHIDFAFERSGTSIMYYE